MTLEKDVTLGEYLRHEREKRGVTIEQVASATKVGVKTLHSLEEDLFIELPAKPFIRGFVTSYCRFIGLDPKDTLSRFDDFMTRKAVERPNRDGGHSGYAFDKKDGDQQSRTILTIAIISFVAVGGLAMAVLKPSLRHHRSSHLDKLRAAHTTTGSEGASVAKTSEQETAPFIGPKLEPKGADKGVEKGEAQKELPKESPKEILKTPEPPTVVPPPSPAEAKAIVPDPKPTPTASATSEAQLGPGENPADPLDSGLTLKKEDIHHKLVFKVLEDVWVRYQVDERPARKFIVRKGKTLILRAKDKAVFQVSNPKSVSYVYNGQGSKILEQDSNAVVKQGSKTLLFPKELVSKLDKPFLTDDSTLPETPDPQTEKVEKTEQESASSPQAPSAE